MKIPTSGRLCVSLAAGALMSFSIHAATLEFAEDVHLLTVNGEPVTMTDNSVDMSFGPQIITVRYDALFEYGVEHHEFVRSSVQVIRFEVIQGEQYAISVPEMDLEQAKVFATSPEFVLTTDDGDRVAYRGWSRDQLLAELLARP